MSMTQDIFCSGMCSLLQAGVRQIIQYHIIIVTYQTDDGTETGSSACREERDMFHLQQRGECILQLQR